MYLCMCVTLQNDMDKQFRSPFLLAEHTRCVLEPECNSKFFVKPEQSKTVYVCVVCVCVCVN